TCDAGVSEGEIAKSKDVGRLEKPVHVLFQPEDSCAPWSRIRADSFENADAIVQPGVDEGNYAVFGISEPVVNPDMCWVRSHGSSQGDRSRVSLRWGIGQGLCSASIPVANVKRS